MTGKSQLEIEKAFVLKQLAKMVHKSLNYIRAQGGGCVVKDVDSVYQDVKTGRRCSIGCLTNVQVHKHIYGTIDSQNAVHLLRKICLEWRIQRARATYSSLNSLIISVLTQLQDIHDECFTLFNNPLKADEQMRLYVFRCDQLKLELNNYALHI